MKGKTGKPSAMRGGGLARKGVGMALKGGGMARKGTGSNSNSEYKDFGILPPSTDYNRSETVKAGFAKKTPRGGKVYQVTEKSVPTGQKVFISGKRDETPALKSGGKVKMTAGAGSGSGRLEKVEAHKAAKRVPATGLNKGGTVKKMKGGGLGKILTQLSPAAMLIKGEMPKMGLLGMGLDAIKGSKDGNGGSKGRAPDQVKKELGLKKGGKVKGK